MTGIEHVGHLAQAAQETLGCYVSDMPDGDPLSPAYTIEVNDAAGVALLRRLLTIDVKNLCSGQSKPSFILNAQGTVIDIAFVSHFADADDHYRVSFHTAETLAWAHQVAKAFDAEFDTLTLTTARVWGKGIDGLGVPVGTHRTVELAGTSVVAVNLGRSLLLQATENDWIDALQAQRLDWIAANTLSILAEEINAIDWMNGEMNPIELGKTEWLDFSAPYRIFIGRALTEALVKHGSDRLMTTVRRKLAADPAVFEEGCLLGVATREGELLAQTYRVGMLGETLIARMPLPKGLDLSDCVCVIGEDPQAFEIQGN